MTQFEKRVICISLGQGQLVLAKCLGDWDSSNMAVVLISVRQSQISDNNAKNND